MHIHNVIYHVTTLSQSKCLLDQEAGELLQLYSWLTADHRGFDPKQLCQNEAY